MLGKGVTCIQCFRVTLRQKENGPSRHFFDMKAWATARRKYRFGLFELDSASGELLRQGVRVKLQDQPVRLLVILLEHAGQVVSQEEVRRELWPADTYVEFDGSLKAALKRLRAALGDSADNLIFIETIPKRGYRFVAPVIVEGEGAPTAELGSQVPQAAQPTAIAASAPPVQRQEFLTYGAAAVALLIALAWFTFRRPSSEPSKSSGVVQAAIPVRKSVAVLGFRNSSARAEDDWLASALPEMLGTELAAGEKLRLVAGEEVANLRLTSPWPQVGTLTQQTAARVGGALNSDVLVLGSYTTLGKAGRVRLRLDVSLQDVRTGDVLAQMAQTGDRNDLFRLTSEIGAKLRERLGVPAITDAEEPSLLASMPVSPEGARFYALGITKLRDFDARAARDLLQQAVAADPKFPLAHAALASAWSQLGYEQKRKEEAKRALDFSANLPRVEKLQVEGDYYESLPDHEKAASTYSALFELFPDNVDYGLQLAYAENAANHKTQGLETVARLRRIPPPASDDPRIDLAEARVLPATRGGEALALRRSAETKATAQGKKLIYARARVEECMNLVYGEHPEQADTPCQDAYNIYRAAGNNLGAADALRLTADLQGAAGHVAEARATYERALKILGGQGENLKTALILNNMAIGYTNEGNLERGEELYREAKLHFERGGDKQNASIALANIADILYLRGDLASAAETYKQVIDINTSLEGGGPEYAMYRLADLELARGHVQEAHQLAAQAVDSLRGLKGSGLGASTSELGDVLHAEGDLRGARQQYLAALEVQQSLGLAAESAESQTDLAELDLDEGRPDSAEARLRPAIGEFEKEKASPDETSAYTLLSRALLAQGKLDDARKAIQHAADLGRSSPDPALKWPIEIQTARVDMAEAGPKPSASVLSAIGTRLRAVIASAKSLGYYELECEARLTLAEVELRTEPALGRSQLETLEKETRQRGLVLLANEAQLLASASPTRLSSAASLPHR